MSPDLVVGPHLFTPSDFEDGDPRLVLGRGEGAFRYQPDTICSACDNLWNKIMIHVSALRATKTKFNHESFELSYTLGDISISARLGCHFCQMIVTTGTWWQGGVDNASSIKTKLKWSLESYFKNSQFGLELIIRGPPEDRITSLLVHQHDPAKYQTKKKNFHGPVCVPPLGRRTDDDDVFAVARTWLQGCLDNHSFCKDKVDHSRRPRRLLMLSWSSIQQDQDPSVKLVDAEKVADEKYVALSHCWGKHTIITATSKNEQQFRQGVDFQALSRTFQDAVKITVGLGYRLIWIDSLCIIQDSKSDWEDQSRIMGSVYANSILTIAALDSQDGSGGCFTYDRNLLGLQPLTMVKMGIVIEPPAPDEYFVKVQYTGEQASPLHQRAWVVQERILSPRTIYYGKGGIFWECRQTRASENWTEDITPCRGAGLRKLVLHEIDRNTSAMEPSKDFSRDFAQTWRTLLTEYSGCMLTYSTDRLMALTGLISEIERLSGFDCVLGIWTHDLPSMLLWQRGFLSGDGSKYHKRLENDMPTWAWASVPGQVTFQLNRIQEETLWQANVALDEEHKTLQIRSCRRKVVMCLKGDEYRYLTLDLKDSRTSSPNQRESGKTENSCQKDDPLSAPQLWGGDKAEKWDWESDIAIPRAGGNVARALWVIPVKIVKWTGHTYKNGALEAQCATAGCLVVTTVDSARADEKENTFMAHSESSPRIDKGAVLYRVGFVWVEWSHREGSPFQISKDSTGDAGQVQQGQCPDGLEDLFVV